MNGCHGGAMACLRPLERFQVIVGYGQWVSEMDDTIDIVSILRDFQVSVSYIDFFSSLGLSLNLDFFHILCFVISL